MGLTVGNIHVYKADTIDIPEVYRDKYCICKLSEDWVTILDSSFVEPGVADEARRLSKKINKIVLSFYCFDEDSIYLQLFEAGKKIAHILYGVYGKEKKSIQKFIDKLDLDQTELKRLNRILLCNDILEQINMLEEFFGIPFIIDQEIYLSEPDEFFRKRDVKLYENYIRIQNQKPKFKNITSCKLLKEYNVCLKVFNYTNNTYFITYPRDDGTYRSESILVSFKNGDFTPLTRYFLLRTFKVFYGEKVIIIGGQYSSEYGYKRDVTYIYDKESGSINSIMLPENLEILDVFANDDLLCKTFINSNETNIPYTLHRVTHEGKVLWTLEIENSECNNAVTYIRHNNIIYISPYNGFLFKIDENGRILGKTFIKYPYSAIFVNGKLILSGDGICEYLFLVLDEDLNIVEKIVDENYQSIIYGHIIFNPYKNLVYIHTSKNQVLALNVNTLQYSIYNLEEHFYLDTIDRNGYIYATGKKVSELYILSSEFKILSKHKLKSQIYGIDTTGENIYVLTSDYTCELLGYKGKSPTHIYEISFSQLPIT